MYQLPLSLPVRERKFQSAHRCIPHFFPLLMPVSPDIVGIGKFLKPCFQSLRIEHIGEPANLFRFHVAVCHLYFHLFQLILFCIDRRITPGLCKMYRNRFFHKPEFPVYAFDLIDHHMIFLFLYSIRPAFHEQIQIFIAEAAVERHLGLISSSHLSLNLFVDSGSLCQRLFICPSASPVVYITGTQDKLHQLPDRNLYFFFFHPPTTFHFAYYNSSTCLCLYFRKSKLIHWINY